VLVVAEVKADSRVRFFVSGVLFCTGAAE
jgi:hypothetical protein